MSLTELLPLIQALPHSDKLRLIQLLAAEFAEDQAPESEPPARPDSTEEGALKGDNATRYPLRGTAAEYRDPTEPVAESDWEALK